MLPRRSLLSVALIAIIYFGSVAANEACVELSNEESRWRALSPSASVSSHSVDAQRATSSKSPVSLNFNIGDVADTPYVEFERRLHGDDEVDASHRSVLSFDLFKVGEPSRVQIIVKSAAGSYETEIADLYEARNSIAVDLAAADFRRPHDNAYEHAIEQREQLHAIIVRLYASKSTEGAAFIGAPHLCAPEADVEAEHAKHAKRSVAPEQTASAAHESSSPRQHHKRQADDGSDPVATLEAEVSALRASHDALAAQFDELRHLLSSMSGGEGTLADALQSTASLLHKTVKRSRENAHDIKKMKKHYSSRLERHSGRFDSVKRKIERQMHANDDAAADWAHSDSSADNDGGAEHHLEARSVAPLPIDTTAQNDSDEDLFGSNRAAPSAEQLFASAELNAAKKAAFKIPAPRSRRSDL